MSDIQLPDIAAEFPQYEYERGYSPPCVRAVRKLSETATQVVAAPTPALLLAHLRKVRDREAGE